MLRMSSPFRNRKPGPPARRTHLGLEELECRSLLTANYFILDFTPDYHAGSFADTFYNTKTSSGYAPRFLDFNYDGYVNSTDASIAAGQVASKVSSFYSAFINNRSNNLTIYYGDVTSNSNWGYQWINYGRSYSSVEVAVMYLGGTSNLGSSILGRAPVAPDGQNIEGYGETYTRSIARNLLNKSGATPTDFVNSVANAAAHELGHMMGLRHAYSSNPNNIMNANQSSNPGSAYFEYGSVYTDGGVQNAYTELDRSFQQNQQQVYGSVSGGQYLHDHDESAGGHELADAFPISGALLPVDVVATLAGTAAHPAQQVGPFAAPVFAPVSQDLVPRASAERRDRARGLGAVFLSPARDGALVPAEAASGPFVAGS